MREKGKREIKDDSSVFVLVKQAVPRSEDDGLGDGD